MGNEKIKSHQIIVIIILSIFLLQVIATLPFKSPNHDEPGHLGKGFVFLKTGDILIITHPPLAHLIMGFPLIFMNISLPSNYEEHIAKADFLTGAEIFYSSNNDTNSIFFWSRLPMILFGVLLGFYVYKWTRELYGIKAGIFALMIYSFNPIIIGNTPLLMTDMIFTCFGFISFYCLWRFLSDRSTLNLILAGMTFGFAQVSKFSALFIIPLYVFFIIISAYDFSFGIMFKEAVKKERLKRLASLGFSFSVIVLMTLLIINITYAFDGFLKPLSERISDDPYSYYNKEYFMPNAIAGRITNNLALKSVISTSLNYGSMILPYGYIKEVVAVARIKDNNLENATTETYFMGKHSKDGFVYYNLFAFIIKSPIPLLIFILVSILSIRYFRIGFRDEAFLILPMLVLFIFFSFFIKIGAIRYILPVFPFIFVFIGRVFSTKITNDNQAKFKRLFIIPIILLLIWYIIESIFIFPNYTAYFNQIIGGPSNGYKYLQGTDLDVGQDLPLLVKYVNENNINNLKFAYGGSADPFYYLNFTCIACPGCPTWVKSKCPKNCSRMSGIIAISATIYASYVDGICFDWLKGYEPIEKLGYTIFVYNVSSIAAS